MQKQANANRFWAKVQRGRREECWPWLGHRNQRGYGQKKIDGRYRGAHRLAYELTFGEIPAGYHIHHRCGNPGCVNPNHLEAMEPSAHNALNRGGAVLTRKQADEIRVAMDALCAKYGVRPQTLADIGSRTTWKATDNQEPPH